MRKALLIAVALAAAPAGAHADVLNVPVPYSTIQKAMDAATAGDTVLVAPGTYTDCTHVSQEPDGAVACVIMKSGVTLSGSGSDVTTIDAQKLGMCVYCKDVVDAVIEGFTLRNADEENGGWQWAPAVMCRQSSPTIRHCDVGPNYDGGVICKQSSDAVIHDCAFKGNSAKAGGGLLASDGSAPTVEDCEFDGNDAPIGGAIYIDDASPTIERCNVTNNAALGAGSGGGLLAVYGSTPTVRHCLFAGNQCGYYGGGLCLENSGGQVIACTIRDNRSTGDFRHGGGVSFEDGSTTSMDSCFIVWNETEGEDSDGGGIYCSGGSNVTLTNCTISNNKVAPSISKGEGGGIAMSNSSPTIERTIVAHSGIGKGLVCLGTSNPVVSCCDIYGNQGGNLVCGTDAGGNFSADPLFCDTLAYNFRIGTASPCAPGNHPSGPDTCGGALIGAGPPGCFGAVEDGGVPITRSPLLIRNTPNPFNFTTTIVFGLAEPTPVHLRIYDVTGREVAALADCPMSVGTHRVTWDGTTHTGARAASGIYFYRLTAGEHTQTGRMVMVR